MCNYLDLTFDLAMVVLTFKLLCELYLRNLKVKEVVLQDFQLGGVGVQHHGVTLIWPLTLPL